MQLCRHCNLLWHAVCSESLQGTVQAQDLSSFMPRDIQNIGSVDALPGSPIMSSRAARARKMETASGFEK